MSATAIPASSQRRYKYGGGPFLIGAGVLFVLMLLSVHDEMTSAKTEWHLWSTKLPIIIPNQVMIGLWWVGLILAGACTLIALLPAASVILNDTEIKVQSPITRNFQTMAFSDIQYIETAKHGLNIFDRGDRKITVNKQMLSKRAYQDVLATVEARSGRVAE